jgi:hypothetical protein
MKRIYLDFTNNTYGEPEENNIIEGYPNPEVIDEENQVTSEDKVVEVDTEEPTELSDDFVLATITPFSMNDLAYPEDNYMVTSLFFIAQTLSGKNCIIYTTYKLDSEEELAEVQDLPFHVESNFSSFRICADIVNNSFPAFITNFKFRDNGKDVDQKQRYTIDAKRVSKEGAEENVVFGMSSDIFASVKYIDNYVFEGDINNYELTKASLSGRLTDNISDVIYVDKIDRIIAMGQMKNTSTSAVEYIVVSGDEKYTLLSTFNFGQKFNKKKFKGMTIERINSTFLNEADQYLQIFSEYCRFSNIDKDYLIIKGKNKDGINKFFLLDGTVRMEFESMIGEF